MNRQVIRSPVARFLVAAGKLAPPVEKSALPCRGARLPLVTGRRDARKNDNSFN
jgi:hypothetical protein